MTQNRVLLTVLLALAAWASPGAAQQPGADSTFRWSAPIAPMSSVVIRTLYGDVRVESDDVDEVRIRAIKSWRTGNPEAVAVKVSRTGPRDRDVLVCGIWESVTFTCDETSYLVNNDGRNDTRVDFIVTVPRRTSVSAESVNGGVRIADVAGEVSGSTVNGSVVVAVRPDANVDVLVSTLNGTFVSDPALGHVDTVQRSLQRRRTARLTLGSGGRTVSLSSVNGELRLVREQSR